MSYSLLSSQSWEVIRLFNWIKIGIFVTLIFIFIILKLTSSNFSLFIIIMEWRLTESL